MTNPPSYLEVRAGKHGSLIEIQAKIDAVRSEVDETNRNHLVAFVRSDIRHLHKLGWFERGEREEWSQALQDAIDQAEALSAGKAQGPQ